MLDDFLCEATPSPGSPVASTAASGANEGIRVSDARSQSPPSASGKLKAEDLQKAIHELSPVDKLHLIEEVAKSLREPAAGTDPRQRKANLDGLRRELAALPVRNPADGFSNRDHDRLLYGERR